MGGLKEYSGLTTKIKAMRKKLMSKEDLDRLIWSGTVEEFAESLSKNPSYEKALGGLDYMNVHRETVEHGIECAGYMDFEKIYRFAGLNQRKYLRLQFVKYEVSLIKKAMRNCQTDYMTSEQLDYTKSFFGKYSDVRFEELFEAKSLEQIIKCLEGTKYYDSLKVIYDTGSRSFFDYELALDMFYFRYVWKKRRVGFNDKDKKMISDTIGTEVDLLNLAWIYRAKKYYKMTQAEILALVIPIYHRVKKKDILSIMEISNAEEMANELKQTPYGKYFTKKNVEKGRVERVSKVLVAKVYNKYSRIEPYSVSMMSGYLKEKQMEMSKLISILECIRYGYSKEDIIKEVNKV